MAKDPHAKENYQNLYELAKNAANAIEHPFTLCHLKDLQHFLESLLIPITDAKSQNASSYTQEKLHQAVQAFTQAQAPLDSTCALFSLLYHQPPKPFALISFAGEVFTHIKTLKTILYVNQTDRLRTIPLKTTGLYVHADKADIALALYTRAHLHGPVR
jgi:hypothetical protein